MDGSASAYIGDQYIGSVQDTKPITVLTPYSKLYPTKGLVTYTEGQSGVIASGPNFDPAGIEWTGSVGTQDMFLYEGDGQWCFMQLCWLNRLQYSFAYPYGPIDVAQTDGALDGGFSIYGRYWDADSQDNRPTKAVEQDNPEYAFRAYPESFQVADTFKLYMMYQPPDNGQGVQWVSLQSLKWRWNTDGSRSLNHPFSPDPPAGAVTADGAVTEHQHPMWTTKYSGHD